MIKTLWQCRNVPSRRQGLKCLHSTKLGLLELELSAFAVDGRPDLSMIVYSPATPQAAQQVRAFINARSN